MGSNSFLPLEKEREKPGIIAILGFHAFSVAYRNVYLLQNFIFILIAGC